MKKPISGTVSPRNARRFFLKQATLAGFGASSLLAGHNGSGNGHDDGNNDARSRARDALQLRQQLAQQDFQRNLPPHPDNGDEQAYPSRIGSFSKGLPHNDLGEVDLAAYQTLLHALASGAPSDFEKITLGVGRKLTDPQAGLAFGMEGSDSFALAIPPAPAFASAQEAGEMAELYWMALLRDVPFGNYSSDPVAAAAAADLSRMSDFRGPKDNNRVTTVTLFRELWPGCLTGPFISQFFWLPAPFGAELLDRRIATAAAGFEYLTTVSDWLDIQRGATVFRPAQHDAVRRYIRNGRDLGEWVHIDVLFRAYLTALLCMLSMGAPADPSNPYVSSRTQIGFSTLGDPYTASLLCAVAKPALGGSLVPEMVRPSPPSPGGFRRPHPFQTHRSRKLPNPLRRPKSPRPSPACSENRAHICCQWRSPRQPHSSGLRIGTRHRRRRLHDHSESVVRRIVDHSQPSRSR